MTHERTGALRLTGTRLELVASRPDGSLVHVDLDVGHQTAHALRHVAGAQLDVTTGQRHRCSSRSLLERALGAVGAVPEQVEVLPGSPPRFVLAMIAPDGCVRRLDLDLVDLAELIVSRRLPVVALNWPDVDWDAALASLTTEW